MGQRVDLVDPETDRSRVATRQRFVYRKAQFVGVDAIDDIDRPSEFAI